MKFWAKNPPWAFGLWWSTVCTTVRCRRAESSEFARNLLESFFRFLAFVEKLENKITNIHYIMWWALTLHRW